MKLLLHPSIKTSIFGLVSLAVFASTPFNAIADFSDEPVHSGLYTNRHHLEIKRHSRSDCPPDFDRALILAEEAVGIAYPGTYHTNSYDVNPEDRSPTNSYEILEIYGGATRQIPLYGPRHRHRNRATAERSVGILLRPANDRSERRPDFFDGSSRRQDCFPSQK